MKLVATTKLKLGWVKTSEMILKCVTGLVGNFDMSNPSQNLACILKW